MPTFAASTDLEVGPEAAFAWHARAGAFERLIPPWRSVRLLSRQGSIRNGDRLVMALGIGVGKWRWVAEHRGYVENQRFEDVQRAGPFAAWVHEHAFESLAPGRTRLHDRITYRLPGGFLAQALFGPTVDKEIARMFHFRHERTRQDLSRHARFAQQPPMRIAMTGASGLIGAELKAFLTSGGHEVISLVRRPPQENEIYWDPARSEIELERLEGLDAVVHLAGESIAGGRWTPEQKAKIRDSRVRGTRLIAEAIAKLKSPPRVLVSASATGFYGNRGDAILDETSAPGSGFLAEVCQAWEEATEPARRAGVRVVNVRTGIVLTPRGGALAQMLMPFRLGLGGVIGSGRQWMSWIGLEDLIGVFHAALVTESLQGPVNATAPHPVTSAEFVRTLGRVIGRPTLFPLPEFAVKLLLGEMGEALLLDGARVLPRKLEATDFEFAHPDLEQALRFQLGD